MSNSGNVPWARITDDPWVGSRRLVQVRPHLWAWLERGLGDEPVLEIGPGLRPTARVQTSTFVDRSEHVLGLLSDRGATVALADGPLAFEDGHFGAVVAFEILEHVQEDETLVAEISRVLRAEGRLLMSVPIRASMWTSLDDICGHVRRYEPEDLFTLMKAHGLEVGGYAWHRPERPFVTKIRTKVLSADRAIATAVVQNTLFPAQAVWQRRFAHARWTAPDIPVPAEAEHVELWARKI